MADLEAGYRLTHIMHLNALKQRLSGFSLRAFARLFGVDPTFLSKILSGKVLLSVDIAAKTAKRLKLSKQERRPFLLSYGEEHRCHALYLVDPTLTSCDPTLDEVNLRPNPRAFKPRKNEIIYHESIVAKS
jgi:transcriptional regulator with XRE-family HTH domain